MVENGPPGAEEVGETLRADLNSTEKAQESTEAALRKAVELVELERRVEETVSEMKPLELGASESLEAVDVQDPLVYDKPRQQLRTIADRVASDLTPAVVAARSTVQPAEVGAQQRQGRLSDNLEELIGRAHRLSDELGQRKEAVEEFGNGVGRLRRQVDEFERRLSEIDPREAADAINREIATEPQQRLSLLSVSDIRLLRT